MFPFLPSSVSVIEVVDSTNVNCKLYPNYDQTGFLLLGNM